ncbi:uncharacterized protein LOC118191009, partial [Stegodyphus dumicola]|uniref:uncharacterized protein LOC118191009 n=1 Tax=Stegodyphus dumicola TaxID=202533 RepID=UPI0015AD8695
ISRIQSKIRNQQRNLQQLQMFPDSEIAQKYACARTKTSSIVNDIACDAQSKTIAALQNSAFSVSIDGSNDSDWKL